MEAKAVAKGVRVQPRKVRIVASHVRGKNAIQAVNTLRFHPSKGAKVLEKVIASAVANAAANHGMRPETLTISEIQVNEGPVFKRIQARAMGRANRIVKKTSHITVVVAESEIKEKVKPHGTTAKARPTFAKPKKKKAKKAKEEVVEETAAEEAVVEAAAEEAPVEEAPAEEAKAEEEDVKAEAEKGDSEDKS
jgi:large subunit ribosomal protein L22